MEIDKKICLMCKEKITDDKEYICTECYNKSLKDLKDNELYQELKNNNIPIWIIGAMLIFALKDKGE